MATGLTNIGGVTYLFGADGAMQYGWYTDASGMRYFQTNGADGSQYDTGSRRRDLCV